jgi:ATPase subunit of ABC transporter with duplicated ATPase domains
MTTFLTLDSISLATPDGRPLFDGLTLALGRERTGVVGRNGCGKSTLLRAIAGEVEPASGSVRRAGSIGVLAQLADASLTVAQALGVANELARLRRLERGEGSPDDVTEADWTLQTRLDAALVETGLPRFAAGPSACFSQRRRTDTRGPGPPADRGAGCAATGRAHQQP